MQNSHGLIGKIGKGLGEYFLGLQTHKYYQSEISFSREFLGDYPDVQRKAIRESKIRGALDVICGKYGLNLADIILIKGYVDTGSLVPLVCIGLVEAARITIINPTIRQRIEYRRGLMKSITLVQDATYLMEQEIKSILENPHNEGEEWKRGTECK